MRLGNWQFTPKLWAVLLYLLVLMSMLGLANWQLERAALKVTMQSAAENAQNSQALAVEQITDHQSAAASYQRVAVEGFYDPMRQFLWDNRSHKGRAGFEVVAAIKLASGAYALINRGWVEPGVSRQSLPDVGLPDAALQQVVYIEGLASQPSKGFASGAAVTGGDGWPKLLQYIDFEAIASALEAPVVPLLVQAQTLSANSDVADVLTSRPEWLIANWQPAASGPAKHYSYAFQWFAMAFALTVIFLTVNLKKVSRQ